MPLRRGSCRRALDTVLGNDGAVDFLKTCCASRRERFWRAGPSDSHATVEADFVGRLKRVDSTLLAIVLRQAGSRARSPRRSRITSPGCWRASGDGAALAARARASRRRPIGSRLEARSEIARLDARRTTEQLVNRMEDVVDELEQAAFIASLMPAGMTRTCSSHCPSCAASRSQGTEAAATGADARRSA